jgi:hypothetical protein
VTQAVGKLLGPVFPPRNPGRVAGGPDNPWFRSDFGRPSKELYTMGVIALQQMHDLTDDDTVKQMAFYEKWQYALNISEEADTVKYMCPKTLCH